MSGDDYRLISAVTQTVLIFAYPKSLRIACQTSWKLEKIYVNKPMVGVRGFEPPTPASRTQYSTRLSYTPIAALSTRGFQQ